MTNTALSALASSASLSSLKEGTLDVWRFRQDSTAEDLRTLQQTLSPEEQHRAARFRFARDRQQFIMARGTLRQLLAAYLETTPARIVFAYTPFGKPILALTPKQNGLCFNLSHTDDFLLYAFAWQREIGVDVEFIREMDDLEALAAQVFTPGEIADLQHTPPEQRVRAFFRCWTRKEACVKASGMGLQIPLERFEVGMHTGSTEIRGALDSGNETEGWSVTTLEVPAEYAAALAVRGPVPSLRYKT